MEQARHPIIAEAGLQTIVTRVYYAFFSAMSPITGSFHIWP